MATKRVADLTVDELKSLIAETIAQELDGRFEALAQQLAISNTRNGGATSAPGIASSSSPLPKRTPEEQRQINQALLEWYTKWVEEGDEAEQRETFEHLQKVLDEDRLSNRPLFPNQLESVSVKQEAQRMVEALAEDATWDDLMDKIYGRQAIDAGLEDTEAERTLDVAEVRARFGLQP